MFTNRNTEERNNLETTLKKVTKLGANWNNGLNTSAFYWNLNNASSNRNRNISSQLVNARNSAPLKYRGLISNKFLYS